jgi:quercetin dioxygenase-like cupin family protein
MMLYLMAIVTFIVPGNAATAGEGSYSFLRTPEELEWYRDSDLQGGERADLLGRKSVDPSETSVVMRRWEPGAKLSFHRHKGSGCHGVVLKGTLLVASQCAPTKELPAGSYFFIAGQAVHSFECKPGAACEFYMSEPNTVELVVPDCPKP